MDFTADLRRRYTSACSACVKDRYLKQIIKNKGKSGKCSACKTKANVFPVKRLAKLVQSIVRENFQKRVEMRIVGDYNYYMYEPISDDLDTVICKVMGEYSDFHNEIIGSLVEIEYAEAEKHRYEYFDELGFYVESPMSLPIQIKWENMLHELKHSRRFFCTAARDFFDEIFDGVDQIKYWNDEISEYESVLTFLPEGTRLYRARLCDSPDVLKAIYEHPFLYVGPPPPAKARAGRMNAEGVVVLYASTDPDTCLAEMRPPLGGNTAVIELKTIKTLQLLNFRRLSKCYKQLSYFQENYADELDRFKFLRFLERRISKPIIPGDEAEYLITETMTEYLAYVHPIAFDGIMYSSAQRSEGINVVLFGHRSDEYYLPAAKFPVAYVNESLKFFSTQAISYTHHEEQMSLIADSVVSDSCPYPYDETNTNYQL